jgi:hypothetical protein
MEIEGIHLAQLGSRKTSSMGVSLVLLEVGFLLIVTIGSRLNTNCSICIPDLMIGDHCIIRNRAASASNHSSTVDDQSHLWLTVNPLPVDKIPKTLLQIQSTTGTIEYTLQDLCTLLSIGTTANGEV